MVLEFNFSLIVVSVLAGTVATYIAFSFINQLFTSTHSLSKVLTVVISVALGLGIWANHLILDLAFLPTIDQSDSHSLLVMGSLFSIVIGYFITANANRRVIKPANLIIDALISSICALCLFYCGISYLQQSYVIKLSFYPTVFAFIFCTLTIMAIMVVFFWIKTFNGKNQPIVKLLSALCVSLGIIFIHFSLHLSMAETGQVILKRGQTVDAELLGTSIGMVFLSLFLCLYVINVLVKKYGKKLFKFSVTNANKTNAVPEDTLDTLTNLPNRRAFEVAIENAVKNSVKHNKTFAVAFIDLDHFKPINDHYGHRVGDTVLKETAARLRTAVRGCDYVARIGGDEFVAIIEQIDSENDALPIAERIVDSIKNSFFVDKVRIDISCSVGVATYQKGDDLIKLLACADAAMYKAKEDGKNQFKLYDAEIESESGQMLELHQDLRVAIKNREFKLLYLPKIHAKTNTMVGAEALIRWIHPTKGEILPAEFLMAAEHFGLIYEINHWVLDECCNMIASAKEQGIDFNVSINLSIQQFSNHQLVKDVLKSIKFYDLSPNNISFEIKETLAISNQDQFKKLLAEFAAADINVILDDFGVQPISLPYLQDLKVNEVKVDRSFIEKLHKEETARSLVDALIKLAHALDFKVVAEGVEEELQSDFLLLLGCDYMQGYLFSKPLNNKDLIEFYNNLKSKQLQIDFNYKDQPKATVHELKPIK